MILKNIKKYYTVTGNIETLIELVDEYTKTGDKYLTLSILYFKCKEKGIDIYDWFENFIKIQFSNKDKIWDEEILSDYMSYIYIIFFERLRENFKVRYDGEYVDLDRRYKGMLNYFSQTVIGIIKDKMKKDFWKNNIQYFNQINGFESFSDYVDYVSPTPNNSAEKVFFKRQFYNEIIEAITILPEKQKKAFYYIEFCSKNQAEIASELNCSQPYVSKLYKSAKKNLRKFLGEQFYYDYYKIVA